MKTAVEFFHVSLLHNNAWKHLLSWKGVARGSEQQNSEMIQPAEVSFVPTNAEWAWTKNKQKAACWAAVKSWYLCSAPREMRGGLCAHTELVLIRVGTCQVPESRCHCGAGTGISDPEQSVSALRSWSPAPCLCFCCAEQWDLAELLECLCNSKQSSATTHSKPEVMWRWLAAGFQCRSISLMLVHKPALHKSLEASKSL